MSETKKTPLAVAAVWKAAKTVLPMVIGLGVLVLVIAWLAGAFEEKIQPERTDLVAATYAGQPTEIVHEVTKAYEEEALGTLKAASRTVVSSKVLAVIEEITVAAGAQVEADDMLVTLNDEEYQARLSQAEQALSAGVATRIEADENLKRQQALWERKAIAKAALDEANRRAQVARAEESRLQQAVEEAKISLAYTTLKAPKSGRVVDRQAEPGDMARPGVPLLTIYDATSLRVEAPVLEHLAVQLRVGQKLRVFVDAISREFEATIDEIVPQADAPSRSFLVKASLPKSTDLYEGMFARLQIPAGERVHLCLPTDALQTIGQLEFVYVVRDDGVVERRFVKTGRLGMPGRIEVLSGVQAGERVVLNPSPAAMDDSE
jgi:RND family efflux transporter MFP subunit